MKTKIGTINVQPSWSALLDDLLRLYESGNAEQRALAYSEFKKAMSALDDATLLMSRL